LFKAIHYSEVSREKVENEGSKGITVRRLITREDGAKNFAMRFFELEPGGHTPLHSHDWEHEVFVLDGKGSVICGDSEADITPGYVVFIPPNVKHCFRNLAEQKLSFLCLIPNKK